MTAVYDAWCGLKDVHAGLIDRVASRCGVPAERLLQSSLLCVALHDVGKLSTNFQRMMRAENDAEYKQAVKKNYRHEVAGLWLVTAAARGLNARAGALPGNGLLETLAVAGHHKYLADGYLLDDSKFLQPLSWEPDLGKALTAAYGLAHHMFKQQGWAYPQLELKSEDFKYFKNNPDAGWFGPFKWLRDCRKAWQLLHRDGDLAGRLGRDRDLFVLLKGLLMTADWMASGAEGHDDALDARGGAVLGVPSDSVEEHVRRRHARRRSDRPELRLGEFTGLTSFQTDCGAAEGHVIATAPTGSGKTEAALLWALRQVERGHVRKVLVLLPTMVTANSIHERLKAFFLEEQGHKVGLVHSTSDLVRVEKNADGTERDDEADRADVRADHLSETHLFRPVTVGTVDQLLVPLFHAGRWALKTLAAADAAVVIDEVHAYEPHTLGLIALMIRQLAPLGTRFLVMSATMPESLKAVIRGALESNTVDNPGVTAVEDDKLLNSARNTWETCETPLSEWLLDKDEEGRPVPSAAFLKLWASRNDRDDPLNILVVVNTVKRCQELAKALHEFGPVCYHSKFIFDDRREKERAINDDPPRLLIATQVVEVSLDIDYDVFLTECAPFDALAQRAGRVNRARRTYPGRVVVHRHEKESETVYGHPRGVLDASWEVCRGIQEPPTECDLIRLVERVYAGHNPAESDAFRDVQAAVVEHQRRLSGVLDSPRPRDEDAQLKTRPEDYLQVSVIPECFEPQARSCLPSGRKRYELKVPYWYFKQPGINKTRDDLPLCAMKYGPEYGAELISTPKHPEPGSMFA